ncbi:MAG: beta-agarase [Bacteroidota bacterium]
MKNIPFPLLYCLIVLVLFLAGCIPSLMDRQNKDIWQGQQQEMILDFESESLSSSINTFHSETLIVKAQKGVTQGQQALQLNLQKDEKNSGFTFKPASPISTGGFQEFCLVFDATNTTEVYSSQLFVTVENGQGHRITRSAVVPVGATKTYFFELSGPYLRTDTGLRDDPNPWDTDAVHMKIQGLKANIDFSEIASINFQIQSSIADKTIVLDNIRLVESPAISADYLVGIVDKYGQNAKQDFLGKIKSDEELKQLANAELEALKAGPLKDRSTYGGWKAGPRLEATGYFRTEKVGDRWALVDPEGYLFFSTGIANVRMANTTSFTGMDFKNDTVRYRDPEDVTPEDSRGMVKLSGEVTSTAYVAYPERNKMFLELPAYDSPLANHYSYRREQHIGPFEHGETFSFYQANLERRYGEPTPDAHIDKWFDVTLDRFLNWGFTSFGNWADVKFYEKKRLPFFANGWIIGDFKTVRSGLDYWGPMPDVFDPEFARRVKVTIDVVAQEVKDNPWCIGIFIDNEKSWGVPGTVKGQYGIVLDALSMDALESPIKAEFTKRLKAKYKTIAALNQAWETEISNWPAFEKGVNYKEKATFNSKMAADFSNLLEAYATKYFKTVHNTLEAVLPNHLYMGCRFASWGMGPEVRKAAIEYVDVFSYNYYKEVIGEKNWEFLKEIDRPSVIGEFHMGAMDAGLFHPGLVHASNQEDRARMYQAYMRAVIDNPYFVGAHWFQYIDSPLSGRAHDGENYNVGFVANTDVPYEAMVKAAKELNGELYTRRFGQQ